MKKLLRTLTGALAALAFAASVSAADYPAGGTAPGGESGAPATMKNDTTSKKKGKKARKKAAKSRRISSEKGTGTTEGTGPHYGTPNLGGPSGNEVGQPPQKPASPQ